MFLKGAELGFAVIALILDWSGSVWDCRFNFFNLLFFSNHAQCQLDQNWFQLHSPRAVFIAVGRQVEIMILSSGKSDVAKVQVQNCSQSRQFGKFQSAVSFRKKTGVLARTKSKTAPDQIPFREVAFQPVFSLLLVDISAWHTYLTNINFYCIILIVIYYVLHWFLVCIFARIFVPKSFWPWITFCCDLGSWNSISWPSPVSKDLSGIKISMQAVIVQGMNGNDASPRFLSTWVWLSDLYKEKVQMDVDEAICPTVDLQSTILSEWSLWAWWSTTSGLGSLAWKSSQIALFQWNIIILPEVYINKLIQKHLFIILAGSTPSPNDPVALPTTWAAKVWTPVASVASATHLWLTGLSQTLWGDWEDSWPRLGDFTFRKWTVRQKKRTIIRREWWIFHVLWSLPLWHSEGRGPCRSNWRNSPLGPVFFQRFYKVQHEHQHGNPGNIAGCHQKSEIGSEKICPQ